MRFQILGPLEVIGDQGQPVAVTRRLHRTALALLLLNAGQPCSGHDLVAALWDDDPPLRPEHSLRTCIYGIRKLLPDASRLRTHASGYLIEVATGELDLNEFVDLAERGRNALDLGQPRSAAQLLSQALRLWRQPPLADLPHIKPTVQLLVQREEVQDALIDARLALGQHRQVVGELRSIVSGDGAHEHAWAQLMLALYRCGARTEALAAFGRIRLSLVNDYGIEPGPELQDLRQRILADDSTLQITMSAWPGPFQLAWRPACQLPASLPDFTGRRAELAVLLGRLPTDGMPVSVVTGMPGIGKTALAVHAAHLARASFPDGQLYARMDHDGRARDPQEVLGQLLRGLGVPSAAIPGNGFEREALYRSVLAGRKVLVLADGASNAAQVRPLLPGTTGCAVLVTSRGRLADLAGARLIDLGDLSALEAVGMLTEISGRQVSDEDHNAATAVMSACENLPLALRIAGARLAAEPGLAVAELANRLADEAGCLDQLVVGHESVRARFAAAAQSVSERARSALTVLAGAGHQDLPRALIAKLLADGAEHDDDERKRGGTEREDNDAAEFAAEKLVLELVDAGLVLRVPERGATYRLHRLVRLYAR